MSGQEQLKLFFVCMGIGAVGGVLYEPFGFLRLLFQCNKKHKKIGVCLDIAFFLTFTAFSVLTAFLLKFPNFRVFWWMGYALGGIIYLKTLHKIIAFFEKVCYNVAVRFLQKAKKTDKTQRKRRIKRI